MLSKYHYSILAAFLILLVLPGLVCSQIPGGTAESTRTEFAGKNYIVGMILMPDGTQVTRRMRIRLSSLTAGEVITTTDDRGRFNFSKIRNGTYTVTVDGEDDFDTTNEQVEVSLPSTALSQSFNVTLRLRAKRNDLKKPAVIKSENAGVPKPALDLYSQAVELSNAGDNRGAVAKLKEAIVAYPEFMVAYTELGVQYAKLNELENADAALQSALKIKPDAFEPLVNRGIVLVRLKRFAEAETVLREAAKAKDLSPIASLYLGRALAGQKKYDDAITSLNYALMIGGDEMKEAHRNLASIYLERDEYKLAEQSLETYLKLNPNAPDAESLRKILLQLKNAPTDKP